MANIGTATLTISPKMTGLKQAIESQLKGVDSSASVSLGNSIGDNISGGFARAGIAAGVFSQITSTVMSQVSQHIGSAISRFDTLNNYPTVMQNLGYSAEQAQNSIDTISDRLSTLPTTLDSMVSVVQGLTAVTRDLDQATNAGLAMNDMLLAAGASTEGAAGAIEQFRKMIAQGKPDMQLWQTLTIAMPGQMKQLAEAMLGTGKNAQDLYTALGGGGKKATISMDQLMNKMIEMDTTSTDSFNSFQQQAEDAAGGVQTSMDNMGNAITRGITSVFDTIGKENIAGFFNTIKGAINDVFTDINGLVSAVMPTISSIGGVIKDNLPTVIKFAEAFVGVKIAVSALKGLGSIVSGVFKGVSSIGTTFGNLSTVFTTSRQKSLLMSAGIEDVGGSLIDTSLSAGEFTKQIEGLGTKSVGVVGKMKGLASGIANVVSSIASNPNILGVAMAALTVAIPTIEADIEKMETLKKATKGLEDACRDTISITTMGNRFQRTSSYAGLCAQSIEESREAAAKLADTISERAIETQGTINQYQKAQDVINEYAGTSLESIKNDKTAYGDVAWAIDYLNEQLNTNISLQDVANDKYVDADGKVQNLTSSINEQIDALKKQARQQALQDNLSDLYGQQAQALITLQQEQDKLNEIKATVPEYKEYSWLDDNGNTVKTKVRSGEWADQEENVRKSQEGVDRLNTLINDTTEAYGRLDEAAATHTKNVSKFSEAMGSKTKAAFQKTKQSADSFVTALENAGYNTDILAGITDSDLAQIVSAYDGTEGSIQTCTERIAEWLAQSGESIGHWRDAFSEAGMSFNQLAKDYGISVEDLSSKLVNAGISADSMRGMSTQAFDILKEVAGNDINALIWLIQQYNESDMKDKTPEVDPKNAEENTQWAKDKLQEWNEMSSDEKTAKVNVEGKQQLEELLEDYKKWSDTQSKTITAHVNTIYSTSGNAQGGIRAHASGAIVNAPGKGVPLDIVGEDGAEAIVPLTNETYAMPFVKMIATEVTKMLGADKEKPTQNFTINANDPNLVAAVVSQKMRMAFV